MQGSTHTFEIVQFILFIIAILCSIQSAKVSVANIESTWVFREAPSGPFLTNQRPLPAVRLSINGTVYNTQILKQQLANELRLPLRDLRIVDPSLPSQIQATFLARPNAILFCLENIKVVLRQNEALIFSPYQSEVKNLIPLLIQQISNGFASHEATVGKESIARFEHVVIEAVLNLVCGDLFRRVRELAPAVASTLYGVRQESRGLDVIQTQVDELLPLKNSLDELRKRVKEIKRAITEILNSDEDLMMMYLPYQDDNLHEAMVSGSFHQEGSSSTISNSHKDGNHPMNHRNTRQNKESVTTSTSTPTHTIDTMSLEMLFENYLNEAEWLSAEIEELLDEITNTEENIVLQLDLLRNRILRFELYLSTSSFVVTCGALITGLFGMNLVNHFETNSITFYLISLLTFSGMLTIYLSFTRYAKREKLF